MKHCPVCAAERFLKRAWAASLAGFFVVLIHVVAIYRIARGWRWRSDLYHVTGAMLCPPPGGKFPARPYGRLRYRYLRLGP